MSLICSVAEKVKVSELSPRDRVPDSLDGVPTDVIATGPIRAFQSRTDRYRPAPGGVSIGHRDITAGTLGCLVKKDGKIHILSNNHVLANSKAAKVGDAILQPGPHDGGKYPDDHIANLTDFVPISFSGGGSGGSSCPIGNAAASFLNSFAAAVGSETRLQAVKIKAAGNLVDAAIARPLNDSDVNDEIMEIGTIQGSASGVLDMAIKTRRTGNKTNGDIHISDQRRR